MRQVSSDDPHSGATPPPPPPSPPPDLPAATPTAVEPSPTGWSSTFRALRHRDFRLYVIGQLISLSGTWMQNLAQSWLVYRLTHSTVLMGMAGFCTHTPVLLLGPLGGLLADRASRRRIVIVTQILFLLQALALAILTLSGQVTVWQVLLLASLWGAINAFDIPARQSLYIHMVGKADLLNAIALNSMIFNTARVTGPMVAGALVAAVGEGYCFLLNALSFLAVIASYTLIRCGDSRRETSPPAWAHLQEGFRYAWRQGPLRALLGVTAATNMAGAPALVLAPVFADVFFQRGSRGLGLLTGSLGIGAIVGTLFLARRRESRGMERIVLMGTLTMALGLGVFAWSPDFYLSMGSLALVGFSIMRQNATANTLIQSIIPDDYRGRIMSLYSMTVVGILPFGSLIGGAVADRAGARLTVMLGAAGCLVAAAFFRNHMAAIRRAMTK